ncbi:MAG: hypothetical protein QNK20_16520 [Aureibaculum sp.]|nr:hypothetical protein [Aureibaculum sp.]
MKTSSIKLEHLQPYRSIETLPIWNFKKVLELGELKYLLKLDDYGNLPEYDKDLQEVWEAIYYEWLDEFGESQKANEYRRAKNAYWVAFWKHEHTGERVIINDIRRAKNRIEQLEKEFNKEETKFSKEVEIVERHRSVILDVFTIPVIKWYRYIESLQEDIKRQKTKKNGRQ